MLTAIKIFATLSLLCSAAYPVWGLLWNRRRDAIREEYRWHMSPIYLHEPQDVIRAKELI